MYLKQLYFTLGIIFSVIYLYIFFGSKIECNTEPKIKINIPPFIVNSKISINGLHIHHWIIGVFLLILLFILHFFMDCDIMYFLQSFSIVLILHGLLYQDCFYL